MKLSKEIGIDLGTANILIYVKGEGIVVNEPSVVTINTETNKPIAVGEEARDMLGKTPGKFQAIRPLKDGVIADFQITEILLTHFINKLNLKGVFSRPTILICCPSNITSIEKSAIQDVALRCGAKRVYIEEEPKVAAIGAGLDISKPSGNMVVDIGGGTTDVATISLGGIVSSRSIRMAGDKLDEAITAYVRQHYNLLIGERTAEQLKIDVASASVEAAKELDSQSVRGRDLISGLPQTVEIKPEDVAKAIQEVVQAIITAIKETLEETSPEIAADVIDHGIVLTGGGAQLRHLPEVISEATKVPVFVASEPLDCVAIGTGESLKNIDVMKK